MGSAGLEQHLEALARQQASTRERIDDLATLARAQYEAVIERLNHGFEAQTLRPSVRNTLEANHFLSPPLELNARDPRVSGTTPKNASPMKRGVSKLFGNAPQHHRKRHSISHSTPVGLETTTRMQNIVASPFFDICMGGVIVLNVFVMVCQLQWKGYASAFSIGLRQDDAGWSHVEGSFEWADAAFNVVYLLEVFVRIYVMGFRYFTSILHLVDMAVVVATTIGVFVLHPLKMTNRSMNFNAVRLVRVFKIFRVVKVLRVLRCVTVFDEMRVLVRVVSLSFRSLACSMLLVLGIVVAAGILMVQITASYVEDEAIDLDTRRWAYSFFGSFTKATYTMFESTFSSAWRLYARPMADELDSGLALFWIMYVSVVNFAVMRIIGAIFLKQTMAVAAVDEERVAMERLSHREVFATQLQQIFSNTDTNHDGVITRDEFNKMMNDEQVLVWLEKLNLEVDEVEALFNVLTAEDDEADYAEFLEAAFKLKSSARTIDTIQIQHKQMNTEREIQHLLTAVEHLTSQVSAVPSLVSSALSHAHYHTPHHASVSSLVSGAMPLSSASSNEPKTNEIIVSRGRIGVSL